MKDYNPKEFKVVALRECPVPEEMKIGLRAGIEAKPINLLFGLVARDINGGVRWGYPAADLAGLERQRCRRRQRARAAARGRREGSAQR